MPSLLAYLDRAALDAIVPDRRVGARWVIHATQLPGLERLDARSSLFVTTIEDRRVLLVATVEDCLANEVIGEVTITDHDITHLLPQLGCPSIDEMPAWADIPRVLQPGDVDLLLSRPAPTPESPPPPPPRPPPPRDRPDPVAEGLRAAVYKELRSDAVRQVYADYLQDHDDPRGELIALQLARHRDQSPSARERALLEVCGAACAGRLAPYLEPGYVLRRGFLAACAVVDRPLPADIIDDPTWATVEDLRSSDLALLRGDSLVSVRRIAVTGEVLVRLCESEHELTYPIVVGAEGWTPTASVRQTGISLDRPEDWRVVMEVGAMVHLRGLSVANRTLDASWRNALLGSRLGKQLLQLDVVLGHPAQLQGWREMFDQSSLHLLTLRHSFRWFELTVSSPTGRIMPLGQTRGRDALPVCVALERAESAHRLVIQVEDPATPELTAEIMRMVDPLGRELDRIEVHDLGGNVRERQAVLFARLRRRFRNVVAGVGPSLAP